MSNVNEFRVVSNYPNYGEVEIQVSADISLLL